MSVPTPDGAAPADAVDYKATVFLPRTAFPMRAGLPKLEPELLKRWKAERLYTRLREQSAGREKFILHDGPPYANGNIHIGTGMNKILKDIVTRSQQMLGKDSNYVPGWDCHGLPIEWKIEEGYRAEGRDKDAVPILELRQECRSFAEHWVRVQSDEFQRLGVLGDWDRPYLTMTRAAEAQIVREIHKFLMNGGLYKGLMPVLWSVVEKTALAEAEVEYADHVSTTIWVRFPVIRSERASLTDAPAGIVIWTTTPWTIPGNRAVAYGADIDYGLYEVATVDEGSPARVGDRLVVATALAGDVAKRAKIADWRLVDSFPGAALAGTVCHHPLHGVGAPENYAFEVPALAGEFVTTEQGTGVVHIAPGHGAEDFELGSRHGLPLPETVAQDGRFTAQVPLFEGRTTYTSDGKRGDASDAVTAALAQAGALLAEGRLTHSYPHSWRSKAPLIFRATPQWFISMEATGLRRTALKALEQTRFCPPAGYNRLSAMIEARPDWCISRQRAWGVPIAIFVERKTGQPLKDQAVLTRIGDIFEQEGSDAWFARDPQDFLGPDYAVADYDQVFDIVDVWFESGATHSYVLEVRDDLMWPASLYLEGSDQHRGWFHSSLLESCGTRGRAPFDAVLTHGFVLDEDGRKMSKSLGNTVMPQEVADANGADILRLWVAGSDYSQDVRIGPEILKFHIDAYRRLRNTMRYLLGALAGFTPDERIAHGEMPELERYILHRVAELDAEVRRQVDAFDFLQLMKDLHNFCAVDLSAFYFDIRKDALYCDRPDALQRRAARTVMDILFDSLTAWLAPVLCFTAEEAWLCRNGDASGSVHERVFPTVPGEWTDPDLATKWRSVREVRRVVTGALELERAEKRLGSSLQAHPTVYVTPAHAAALAGLPFHDVVIASAVTVLEGEGPSAAFRLDDVPGVAVVPGLAEGEKCERCWKTLPEVGDDARFAGVCGRCADAVAAYVDRSRAAG